MLRSSEGVYLDIWVCLRFYGRGCLAIREGAWAKWEFELFLWGVYYEGVFYEAGVLYGGEGV